MHARMYVCVSPRPRFCVCARVPVQIYTRWVNQKLGARMFPTMTDICADLGKDAHLSNLVTALSDNEMPKGRCV